MLRIHARRAPILFLLPVFAVLTACPFDPPDRPDPPITPISEYLSQVTISNVLHNLRLAYVERKHEEYGKLLDDAFTFVFDPRDVGPEKPWSDLTWGRGDELDSAWNMFNGQPNMDDQVVDRIELAFDEGTPRISEVNDEWKMVTLTAVDLKLFTTEQHSGDEWILETPGGYEANLHFVQTDEVDPKTEAPVLKIVLWEDKPPR